MVENKGLRIRARNLIGIAILGNASTMPMFLIQWSHYNYFKMEQPIEHGSSNTPWLQDHRLIFLEHMTSVQMVKPRSRTQPRKSSKLCEVRENGSMWTCESLEELMCMGPHVCQ